MDRHRPPATPVLFLGILAIATGGLFARLADAPATSISFWRCAIATAAVFAIAPTRRWNELRQLKRRQLALGALAGLLLALHFATWIRSLELTTIAASVILVNTNSIWVGLLTPLFTHDRLRRATVIGIALAFAGSAILAIGTDDRRPGALVGNALAVAGGLAGALYLLAGRRLREHVSLGAYTTLCYGSAALVLLIASIPEGGVLGDARGPYSGETWIWLAACGAIPQLIGHTSFNWALRWLPAAVISVSLLGEPLIATALGWVVLNEVPGLELLWGGSLILAGIACAALADRGPRAAPKVTRDSAD